MEIDPDKPRTTFANISMRSIGGIGVLIVTIIATLPNVWNNADLRGPYVIYFFALSVGLILSIAPLILALLRDELTVRAKERLNICAAAAAMTVLLGTVLFAYQLMFVWFEQASEALK